MAHLYLFGISNKCGPKTQQFKDKLVLKYVKNFRIFKRRNIPKFTYVFVDLFKAYSFKFSERNRGECLSINLKLTHLSLVKEIGERGALSIA